MYGPEHMMTLDNLERIGLLEESSRLALAAQPTSLLSLNGGASGTGSSDNSTGCVRHTVAAISAAYANSLRRSLRLQVSSSSGDPTSAQTTPQSLDAAFANLFGGTVPVSVRLVQAMALGWPTRSMMAPSAQTGGGALLSNAANSAIQAGRRFVSGAPAVSSSSGGYVTSLLPAVEVDETQTPGEVLKTAPGSMMRSASGGAATTHSADGVTKTVVIAFVGGVTHSELAALRRVAAFDEGKFQL